MSAALSVITDARPERNDAFMGKVIRRAQTGDLDAFETLYRLHYRMILGNHRRIVRHWEDAEDLTSLTFLAMYSKLATSFTLAPTGEQMHGLRFRRWLLAIATNLRRTYWSNGHSIPRLPGTGTAGREWHRLSEIDRLRKTATCSICGENTRVKYRAHRDRFSCTNTASGESGAVRRKKAKGRKQLPQPYLPATNGRSVVSYPVSPDWVLKYVTDAVSDFAGVPEDSPVWAAFERAVQRPFVSR